MIVEKKMSKLDSSRRQLNYSEWICIGLDFGAGAGSIIGASP